MNPPLFEFWLAPNGDILNQPGVQSIIIFTKPVAKAKIAPAKKIAEVIKSFKI